MAIVKDNILMQLVRGTIGKQLTIYERNGQVIMAKKRGPSRKKPTQRQLEARERMAIAADIAREMMADPEIKAYYASLAGPAQNAYNMAVKDAYRSPEVQNIRLEKDEVVVTAKNEFRVAEVEVEVKNAEGVVTERGKATLAWNGIDWHYKPTTLPAGGKVVVLVTSLPRRHTEKELLLE